MNERIKELYNLALEEHRSSNMAWEEVNFEKFAELIIRECAELATKEYDQRGALHGKDLLEHFGIK